MSLENRIALVTGGGSGIGRAICERLASEGAHAVAADLNRAAAEQTVEQICRAGGKAIAVQMNVANYEMVLQTVAEVRTRLGPVDILVNNAGWDRIEPFLNNTPEFWTEVIDVNLRGPIHCCRAVLDDMVARNHGKIVSISSDAARVGSSGEAVYSACKGGIISFSKTLAREMARHQINVNVVCPGPTETPLVERMISEGAGKLFEALKRATPFGRLAQPVQIAAAVAFLVSADADFITGQVLSVSGGLTMAG
jgi:2-hydroxycyclohexanecarboxyl-CoA dehydrogenase